MILIGYSQICRGTFTLTVSESSQPYSTLVYVSVVCIHFTIFFSDLLSLQRQYPLPWSESELTIPGTKVAGNIRSREQKFPGAKVPGNFRSWERRFPLGTRSEQRKYRGAKSPDTSLTLITCRYVTSTRYVLLCH